MLPFSSVPLDHCAGFPVQCPGGGSPTPVVTTSWDQESHCRQTRAILPSHYTSHSEEGVAGDQGPSPLTRPDHAMGCHEYMLLWLPTGRRNLCPYYIFYRPFLACACGQCGTGQPHSSLQDIYHHQSIQDIPSGGHHYLGENQPRAMPHDGHSTILSQARSRARPFLSVSGWLLSDMGEVRGRSATAASGSEHQSRALHWPEFSHKSGYHSCACRHGRHPHPNLGTLEELSIPALHPYPTRVFGLYVVHSCSRACYIFYVIGSWVNH